MNTQEHLKLTVQQLYKTFKSYKVGVLDGCSHCIFDTDRAQLLKVPMPLLSANDLDTFVVHAIHLWGDVSEFKHFLPRIFELIDEFVSMEFMILNRLELAEWRTWPIEEQQAVENFIEAWWRYSLNNPYADIDRILSALGDLDMPIDAFLSSWHVELNGQALKHLITFCSTNGYSLLVDELASFTWKEQTVKQAQIVQWLNTPHLRMIIRSEVDQRIAIGDPETLWRITPIVDWLMETGKS
jgi:hypothetical protein